MATQSLRSRPHPHRIHGVHTGSKALLFRIHRPSSWASVWASVSVEGSRQTMTCSFFRSRFRWLRKFCSLLCAVFGCCAGSCAPPLQFKRGDFSSLLCALCVFCVLCVSSSICPSAHAQNLDKPSSSIDEEITAFSFAPDGGIAFSVYHNFKTKKYRPSSGSFPSPYEGPTFRDVAWLPGMNFAVPAEQAPSMRGPPRLQYL